MAVIRLYRPTAYQKPIINALEDTKHKYITVCMSRRIGKTLTAKNIILKWALTERCGIGYVTPTSALARKLIKEIVNAMEGSGAIRSSNNIDMFIEFTNGSIIYFMSAESKNSNRGSGYKYIVYDEAAYIANDVYVAVFKPMELQAAKVLTISTPNGAIGFFYEMYNKGVSDNDAYKRYISFKTTLTDSMLYDAETIQEIKEGTTSLVYSQEYDCEFISGGISCFGDVASRVQTEPYQPVGKLYAGIDFSGDGADETVITIVDDKCNMIFSKSYSIGNSDSINDMASILIRYNVDYCLAEKNSMGSISIDYLKKQYKRIDGITTTNETKRDYVENVISNFENGIGSIHDDQTTIMQFQSFVLKRTTSGKITYANVNDNMHDDRVIAYCLACMAQKTKRRYGLYVLS